jgi:hypothetical protein
MAARNSEALEVFLRVAADLRVSWRTVELAGRGISADAAGVTWVISRGKGTLSGEDLSDLLIEQGDLVDELVESWSSFEGGKISPEDLEMRVESAVLKLEGWVSRALRK